MRHAIWLVVLLLTMRRVAILAAITVSFALQVTPADAVVSGACKFDTRALAFEGSPVEQAKCLLRRVKVGGKLDATLSALPPPLDQLVGQPIAITKVQMRAYLAANKIAEGDIGGSLNTGVSKTEAQRAAQYFVIHDTSTPNCSKRSNRCATLGKFPENPWAQALAAVIKEIAAAQ